MATRATPGRSSVTDGDSRDSGPRSCKAGGDGPDPLPARPRRFNEIGRRAVKLC